MGLQSKEVVDGILEVQAGDEAFVVYPSEYAGTNKATAMTWVVGDQLEKTVEALKKKGVTFEHYDLPDTVRKGDIHESGGGPERVVQGSGREHPRAQQHGVRASDFPCHPE